jgi:hypothetical protein
VLWKDVLCTEYEDASVNNVELRSDSVPWFSSLWLVEEKLFYRVQFEYKLVFSKRKSKDHLLFRGDVGV